MSFERARLFVALDLPDAARSAAAAWGRALGESAPGWRLVETKALHVTLCFLGDRDASEVGALVDVVAARVRPVGSLSFSDALALPRRRPRVLALAVAEPARALAALHDELWSGIEAAIGVTRERRRFRPHVTVARTRGAAVGPLPPAPELLFSGAAVTLYRSELGAGPARYAPLERVPL